MKKKVLSVLLVAAMAVSLAAGCGQTEKKDGGNASQESSVQEAENAGKSEDELWKEEPAYGRTLVITGGAANCVSAVVVADILGFMEEEGLDVEVQKIGSTEAMNAVATGKADFVTSHISQMTVPIINGLGLKMVGSAMTGCQSLYVLNDSPYQTTKDLVGKKVNIASGTGSQDHNIVLRFMQHDGLQASDYQFGTTELSAVVQAMQNGEIDASLMGDMFAAKFVQQGILRPIRSLTTDEDFKDEPCCSFAVNADFLEKNPITVKKMVRAAAKASAWIDSHTEQSVQLMLDHGIMSGDDIESLNQIQGSFDWTVTQAKTEETLKLIIEEYKDLGLIDKSKDSAELLDTIWDGSVLSDDELEQVWEKGRNFEATSW